MAKRNPAHLDGALLARKGEAAPARASAHAEAHASDTSVPGSNTSMAQGTRGTIAVTLRLDPERYQRLVQYGARFVPRRTNQEILMAALDAYLAQVE